MTQLLVTGCGRSGTYWFAECLRRAGVTTTHEYAFTPSQDGTQRPWSCEVSPFAAVRLPVPGAEVIHLVRHPLDKMASSMGRGVLADNPPTRGRVRLKRWVIQHIPEVAQGRTFLERLAIQWVAWNRMIEPHAGVRLRVESVTPGDVVDVARIIEPNAWLDTLPPPVHTSRHPGLSWARLAEEVSDRVYRELTEMAERYGYPCPSS